MSKVVFKSKMDTWLVLVLLFAIGSCLVACVFAFFTESLVEILIISGITVLTSAFIVWCFVSTYYAITVDKLVVKSGPFVWKIDLKTITKITASRNPISSPALSLDRLCIEYKQNSSLLISPKNKVEFLSELQKRTGIEL
ncbi:PH domain-containing protein [Glaciecola sp. 1036]|uniref:PH domain-containing protein n=1 Tax=Alteromonadaceae TaxID=72275 RepID=UPI003CFC9D49